MRPGMFIQDKEITASIHYRKAEDPDAVQRDLKPVMEGLAATHGLEFFEGRRIFELRPPIPVNKGTAFRRLCEQYRLDAAVFLGDDTTDAHGLTAARAMRAEGMCYAVGVGVESTATPAEVVAAADVFTSGVDDVETFLAWLLEVRSASSS
jgi:trehalose 6-phosphate phosphatase